MVIYCLMSCALLYQRLCDSGVLLRYVFRISVVDEAPCSTIQQVAHSLAPRYAHHLHSLAPIAGCVDAGSKAPECTVEGDGIERER